MILIPLLIAMLLGAAAGPLLAHLSARRSAAQPLGHHPAEEEAVLASVLARPVLYLSLRELEAEHFTSEPRRRAWAALVDAFSGSALPSGPVSPDRLDGFADLVPADVAADVSAAADRSDFGPVCGSDKELMAAASKVFDAGLDRTEYVGRARVEYRAGDERPVVRVIPPPGPTQHALASVMAAAGTAAAMLLGRDLGPFAIAGLVVLSIGCVIWTLVDLDTLYVDTGTFWPLTALSWLLVLAGIAAGGASLWAALVGLAAAGAVVGLIEVINQVFMRLRGQVGMGGGDYLLILATIGVPVAVAGNWVFGYWALMTSMGVAIAGWVLARMFKPGFGRHSPFAFGPALAAGWIVTAFAWEMAR